MTTSLQYLHQNLSQLKFSKLMNNELFRDLYDEAKVHQKNANLNNLVSRARNDKMARETNFYLILTRMLNEIKSCDETDSSFKTNMEKIYKWYLQNRTPPRNKKNKGTQKTVPKKSEFDYEQELLSRKDLSDEEKPIEPQNRALTNSPRFSTRPARNQSPVYFGSAKKSREMTHRSLDTRTEPATPSTLIKSAKGDKRDETSSRGNPKSLNDVKSIISNKTADLINESNTETGKRTLNSPMAYEEDRTEGQAYDQENIADYEDPENAMSNTPKPETMLKILSTYANELFNNIDTKDPRKLHSHLKSLSKFYDTLNDTMKKSTSKWRDEEEDEESEGEEGDYAGNITMQSLVELAKEVSDKMILSRAETEIRISENKKLMEQFRRIQQENSAIITDKFPPIQPNGYTLVYKEIFKRPRSSASVTDWRGQITRPQTGSSSRRKLLSKKPLGALTARSYSSKKAEHDAHSRLDSSDSEPEKTTQPGVGLLYLRRRQSGVSKMKPFTNTITSDQPGYVNFVQKMPGSKRVLPTLDSQPASMLITSVKEVKPVAEINEHKTADITIQNDEKLDTVPPVMAVLNHERYFEPEKSFLSYESYKTEKVVNCVHDEIILCECCKDVRTTRPSIPAVYPMTPMVSFVNSEMQRHQPTPVAPGGGSNENIFHLTSAGVPDVITNDNLFYKIVDDKGENKQDQVAAVEPNLRDILISNYDPRLATEIGVGNFVPIEVMSRNRNLEFIPFEVIDQSYPKINGQPVFDPNQNRSVPKVYHRTNPTIPRPESRNGTRSVVYDQIIELKKQNMDSSALVVWQPEDVHLVRDLLELEAKPITDSLKVVKLRKNSQSPSRQPYLSAESEPESDDDDADKYSKPVNTQTTPNGRPVNKNKQIRWRPIAKLPESDREDKPNEDANEYIELDPLEEPQVVTDVAPKPRGPKLSVYGNKMGSQADQGRRPQSSPGRPIPSVMSTEDPLKMHAAYLAYTEAKNSVHIPSLFRGDNEAAQKYVRNFDLEERARREEKQMAAMIIQQNYRKHLKDKRFIESRMPIDPELVKWAREYKKEIEKRRVEQKKSLKQKQKDIEKENAEFKKYLERIGAHADIHQVFHKKGYEYTKEVLDKAATCIQRWVRGWLLRKEINKLKQALNKDGVSWSDFTKRYRRTIMRLLKIRGEPAANRLFDFQASEALDFYLKEKKYTSYFDSFSFQNEIELAEVEKMFNYLDYFPNSEELKEAKLNVLKYYKRKPNSTSISKDAMFDLIYFIYPPQGSKLKSTRKSNWLNPVVGDNDALRLKGSKLLEDASFDKVWKLMRESMQSDKRRPPKNTPDPEFL